MQFASINSALQSKRQYLLTLQVSRNCLLPLHGRISIVRSVSVTHPFCKYHDETKGFALQYQKLIGPHVRSSIISHQKGTVGFLNETFFNVPPFAALIHVYTRRKRKLLILTYKFV